MTKMNTITSASPFETLDDTQLGTTTGGLLRPVAPVPRPLVDAGRKLAATGAGYLKRGWNFVKDHVTRDDIKM